jgi:hypothetical protein
MGAITISNTGNEKASPGWLFAIASSSTISGLAATTIPSRIQRLWYEGAFFRNSAHLALRHQPAAK